MIGLRAAVALAALFVQPGAESDEAAGRRLVTAVGYVTEWGEDDGSWLALDHGERRFRLPQASGAGRDALFDLIQAAAGQGFALRVRYDATAGEAGLDLPFVIYPICSLAVGDAPPVGDEAMNCPPASGSGDGAEARFALGVGIAPERPAEARALLAEALSAAGLPAHLRALGYRVRGEAAADLAGRHPPDGPEYDRLIAEALSDYRNWLAATPDDADAHLAVSRALVDLGGYDDAVAVLEGVGRAYPEHAFDVVIKTGAIYRQRGDHRRALRQLDDYAAREGTPEGMRFHYHRGWTLMMLGRNREAAKAADEGLRYQPDYAWAYLLRSCVQARLGRLPEALADQERAYALLRLIRAPGDVTIAEDLERSRLLVEALRAAVAAGRREPLPAGCESFWARHVRVRARSPLLGPAS